MSSGSSLSAKLSQTTILGLKLWVLIGLCVGLFIIVILCILSIWFTFRKKSRRVDRFSVSQIPNVTKDIRVDRIGAPGPHEYNNNHTTTTNNNNSNHHLSINVHDKSSDRNSGKMFAYLGRSKSSDVETISQCSSVHHHDKAYSSHSGDDGSFGTIPKHASSYGLPTASPLVGLPEISHLGWGHWFTLRDLEMATHHFSATNIIGEGGYGVVFKGLLVNGTEVAVKRLVNNMGQAEKEFRVEVEAIGHVRHKNLVRLLGYCIEGVHRMLVYEYVNNGNLEQWIHGAMRHHGTLTWEARIKVLLGTAKALAYLHESIEPKVVHRDIKSSNILIDTDFNAKVSDFGLAKLLDSGESHITTRVMGTFGYVAPEYANSGLLNEKSDIYSFGVLLLEAITARDPVDYSRPANEVNLVEWLKVMVGTRRAEEVVDPNLEVKPTTRALKRALLVALRCIDPDPEKRPRMSQVVRMLDADEVPNREDRRSRKSRTTSMEFESVKDTGSSVGDEISISRVEDTDSIAPSSSQV
ncbi:probable receptor-like protein kinase At2g42960 [Chenopodium quinoa]|uniref:probable receptor-like protein kinase At2g42960 n=1 Tax=Chenopodium quinoa TaxID=63459 RepID=UPI000B784D0B|nr:probable receptor-like protein kinase At2g42960 [Chenopodium quinoa]